jgi:hypothetical protein
MLPLRTFCVLAPLRLNLLNREDAKALRKRKEGVLKKSGRNFLSFL